MVGPLFETLPTEDSIDGGGSGGRGVDVDVEVEACSERNVVLVELNPFILSQRRLALLFACCWLALSL